MSRYFSSFFISLSFYALFGFGIYYLYSNNKIEIFEKPKNLQIISLNQIELKPQINEVVEEQKVQKDIQEEKIIKKEEPIIQEKIAEIKKPIVKKEIKQKVEKDLQVQAEKYGANITEKNYNEVLNQAPYNPYLIEKISNYLTSKNKKLEAYNVAFYAAEVNSEAVVIWETLGKKAIDISEFEYAMDGIKKLETITSNARLESLKKLFKEQKQKVQSGGF
mgnify:CR=1 FL=1